MDSTTGVQMAYVKQWAPRSFNPLELRAPDLLPGSGRAVRGDACRLAATLGQFDVAYLDPPYNQHRYFTNYHIWETLVAWDAPDHYGVACKRIDCPRRGDQERLQLPAHRCRRRSGRSSAACAAGCSSSRTTTKPGSPGTTSEQMCAHHEYVAVAGLRLQAVRGGPDRHLQPGRREGRHGVAPAQRRVRGGRRAPRGRRARRVVAGQAACRIPARGGAGRGGALSSRGGPG